jgi:two-component sensor histidine kinase
LSSSIDEEVAFDEVVDRLLVMLADVSGAASTVQVRRDGTFGELPAELATPLVMVLTELVQNSVEHGLANGRTGTVAVGAERVRGVLIVTVTDDGAGLPVGFSVDRTDRLGLQIVRTLVAAELDATLDFRAREKGQPGTVVTIGVPLSRKDRGSLA